MKERYTELTDDIKKMYIHKQSLTGDPVPVFMDVIYCPELMLVEKAFDVPPQDIVEIKHVLLPGYAWKKYYSVYVEYLNLDGYLETRSFGERDFPTLFLRQIGK